MFARSPRSGRSRAGEVALATVRVLGCSLLVGTAVGCAASGLTDSTGEVSPSLGAASGANYSTQSTHAHDSRERVVISGTLPRQVGDTEALVATACEPLEHLQKQTTSPCGTRWMVDRDAKLTWSSTNDNVATVDDEGVVTLVGSGPYAIIAYSSDNGGACTAVGTQQDPVYYDADWKKDHQHLSSKHQPRRLRCDYRDYQQYPVESNS